jgi:AIPR protein
MNPTIFTIPVVSFRNVETPFQKEGYREYFAVIDTRFLPDELGSEWMEINARTPKLTGAVPKAIRDGFHDEPDMFVFMNRGLVIAAEKVSFDNKESTVTITLTTPKLHGLLDGGHTYKIVKEENDALLDTPSAPRYIRVEFLEGFDHDAITNIVGARNTSNQVKDQSLMNLEGQFKYLRLALKDTQYVDKIAFKENELDVDENPKPIDVREVIAILTAFEKQQFGDDSHPIIAYSSKKACLDHFRDSPEAYRKFGPLAQDMLALYDDIRDQLPRLYNDIGGKFGRLTGVTKYNGRKRQPLYYIEGESEYGVPDGFVYPILGAFRALLEERADGMYSWGKGLDPAELLRGELGHSLAAAIGRKALEDRNPSRTGKSVSVWSECYLLVQNAYLKA